MKALLIYIFPTLILCFVGCSIGDRSYESEFIIKEGFQIQCVAAEPLISVPVEMEMDEDGNMWVVELTGYMRDIDGNEENKPDGKIVKLEDVDGDGIMDKRTVFLDNLMAPRAICLINNGVLYSDGKMLKWIDIKGRLSSQIIVDSNYITGSNIEHQPNGLFYHIDNWIYSARSNSRYQYRDNKWVEEITHFRGQWGISADEMGRLIYNDNSNLIRGDAFMPGMVLNNPHLEINYSVGRRLTHVNRVNPLQPTAVNRGYQKGVLDEEGKLIKATSACSPVIYNGQAFEEEYAGDAFVCVPEINAVKHLDIKEENGRLIADNDTSAMEFLTSKDETFRPVNLHNGPDGALYVVDMRKGIIQHRAYMTDYLRENILKKQLEEVIGKGRIYKVQKEDHPKFVPPATLIEALKCENGYLRLNAQKRIIEDGLIDRVPELELMVMDGSSFLSRVHALWTLEGLQQLKADLLINVISKNKHPALIAHVLWLSDLMDVPSRLKKDMLDISKEINDPFLEMARTHFAAKWSYNIQDVASTISIEKYRMDTLYAEALVSGLYGKEDQFKSIQNLITSDDTISQVLLRALQAKEEGINHLPTGENIFYDARTKGMEKYSQYCASCHRMDGKGLRNLAPPLVNSFILGDDPRKSALVILQGLRGPIHAGGKRYNMNVIMPGLKNNPHLSDQDVADIIHFVRNAFVAQWTRLDSTDVNELRATVNDRSDLFTEEELNEICF